MKTLSFLLSIFLAALYFHDGRALFAVAWLTLAGLEAWAILLGRKVVRLRAEVDA